MGKMSLTLATQMVHSEPGRRCVWGGMGVQFLVEGTEQTAVLGARRVWVLVGWWGGGDSRKFGQSINGQPRVLRAAIGEGAGALGACLLTGSRES